MKNLLLGAMTTVGLGAAITGGIVAAGVVDVGADTPHSPLVHQALAFARERSIASRTDGIGIPGDFADPERVRRGAGNYAAMCVGCHLSPESSDSEIRRGLYPVPPDLSARPVDASSARNAARDFWIIKHGIKASGMPAWSRGGMEDEAIWDLAAFLQNMPTLSASAYERLVASSEGHSHGGLAGHDHAHEEAAAALPQPPAAMEKVTTRRKKTHAHGEHDHAAHRH